MKTKDQLSAMEDLYMALADRTRLRILNLLREDEICVCFFSEALGESQPKISRHLAYLRKSGLVESRRDGKWMHYRLADPGDGNVSRLLGDTLEWLWGLEEMRNDYAKLTTVCCAIDQPVTIARAPKPEIIVEREAASPPEVFEAEELETHLL